MSAEGHLYNAALFASLSHAPEQDPNFLDPLIHPPHADLALEYLTIVRSLKTRTALSAVKGHLFKIMRPALSVEKDLRDRLGKARGEGTLNEYWAICEEMKGRMEVRVV
jgi:tRNA-dihydrouridine synthase 1